MHTTFNGKGDTRYIIESHLTDNGGRAWSVIEEVDDGRSRESPPVFLDTLEPLGMSLFELYRR
jgi:hypothetical protein